MVQLGIPVLSILVLKYWYPRVNQQRGTVVFPQTLQIQSDHLKIYWTTASKSMFYLSQFKALSFRAWAFKVQPDVRSWKGSPRFSVNQQD